MSYHEIRRQIDDLNKVISKASAKDRQRRTAHLLKEQLEARLAELHAEHDLRDDDTGVSHDRQP